MNEEQNNISEPTNNSAKTRKLVLSIGLGLTFFAALATAYLVLKGYATEEQASKDNGSNIAVFIPIWAGALIPLIAAKRKNTPEIEKQKASLVVLLILCIVALAVGVVIYFIQ